MDPANISVTRTLAIDGALLGDVLLRLRRDCGPGPLRWTLGDRGVAEVDVKFTSVGNTWTTTARVWDAGGLAVAGVALRLDYTGTDAVQLTLQPTTALTPFWLEREEELLELAHAAIDELSEELLWHASRTGVTSGS
jgi:hypothetical protein